MNANSIKITVGIPVGPDPAHRKWLHECVESVLAQTQQANEILFVDDQAHLTDEDISRYVPGCSFECTDERGIRKYRRADGLMVSHYRTPWLAGVTFVFNCCVSLASHPWTLMLGSDDKLLPRALEMARNKIAATGDLLGYYNYSCSISDTGDTVNWFNNAAVASRQLWKATGGFHPMTVTGGMDAALISVMMVHMPTHLHKIADGTPLYWVRQHAEQYTQKSTARYGGFVILLRNDLTKEWTPPTWTR